MTRSRVLVGLIVALLGAIWMLQGIGVLDGGLIASKPALAAAGVVVGLIGLILMARAVRGRRRPPA